MAAPLVRRRGVLALSLSSPLGGSAFHPRLACRAPSTTSRLRAATSSAAVDDPSLTNTDDYEWLKRSRPMRIRARPLSPNGGDDTNRDIIDVGTRKIVHFLRHGQGAHNQLYKEWTDRTGTPLDLSETDPAKNPMLRPDVVDARLTRKGMDQCAQTRSAASALEGIELIAVSPLMRTLETAHIAFEDHLPHISGRDVKWIAHEGIREELGMLVCNKRRPLSETAIHFPHVDYTRLPDGEEDALWDAYAEQNTCKDGITLRESTEDMSHRAYDFLTTFVHQRPEREIAVVGHSAWLLAMTGAVLDIEEEEGGSEITSMFGQAELRSMELLFLEQYDRGFAQNG